MVEDRVMYKWIDIGTGGWCIGAKIDRDDHTVMMRHYHTGCLFWIDESGISPYVVSPEFK